MENNVENNKDAILKIATSNLDDQQKKELLDILSKKKPDGEQLFNTWLRILNVTGHVCRFFDIDIGDFKGD